MPSAPIPQPVVTPLTPAAIFATLVVEPGKHAEAREALGDISGLVRSIGFRSLEDGLVCVTGIGADFWDRAFTGPRPSGLHPFTPLHGETHSAPSTPGDLFFHIRAQRMDLCFEMIHRLALRLRGIARIIDETHGFRYWDARDLLGFVDGTENPQGALARHFALTDADADYPSSSYVIVQKYSHDLDAWRDLSVEQQEAVFGRTKLSDMEIPDDEKAPNSHLALNVIEDDEGNERKILRDNMPFGSVSEGVYGTYFIGYAADVTTTEQMLENMFIGDPPGNHDRVLDFSTALTGSLFFVPNQDALDDPDLLDAAEDPEPATEAAPLPDPASAELSSQTAAAALAPESSLGIGGLRDRPQF
ncbi:MAG: Dyp-type peroxidase [Leucobacter sp.]